MSRVRPVSDWPEILCGPILRHSNTEGIHVFLVRKSPGAVAGRVYRRPEDTPSGTSADLATGTSTGIRVGKHFYAHLLHIQGTLPTDAHLHYGLTLTQSDGTTKTLGDLGLLSGDDALGYAPAADPSFMLAGAADKLRILHASCRKLHGGGGDALILADAEIEKNLIEESAGQSRPRQFIFTGDQIYADDVYPAFLQTIAQTSRELLGWTGEDKIKVGSKDLTLDSDALDPTKPARKTFATKTAEFTSEHAEAHLATLAEYLTMYVMSWSDALWPRESSGAVRALADQPTGELAVVDDALNNLTAASRALGKVRRVLANVPCYMMFDDHEVTDDWDIDREWHDTVRANSAGRTIMRNGLMAYGLFQDWGNQPDSYGSGQNGRKILDALTAPAGGAPAIFAKPKSLDKLFGLDAGGSIRWNWRHDFPSHRLTTLDCRTRRDFPAAKHGAPELIEVGDMKSQLGSPTTKPLHIVLSGTPVIGAPAAELPQAAAISGTGKDLNRTYDNEAWGAHAGGFFNILQSLADVGGAVIVSGDVHYAFTVGGDYHWKDGTTTKHAKLIQLCASSLNNATNATGAIGATGHPFKGRIYVSYGHGSDLKSHGAKLRKASFPAKGLPTISADPVESLANLDVIYNVVEGLKPPARLPVNHWLTDKAAQEARKISRGMTWKAWYELSYEDEVRIYDDFILGVDKLNFPSEAAKKEFEDQNKPDNIVGDRLDRKQIVGRTNFGSIRLELDNGTVTEVVHDVHYRILEAPGLVTYGTMRHRVDAEVSTVSNPPAFRKGA